MSNSQAENRSSSLKLDEPMSVLMKRMSSRWHGDAYERAKFAMADWALYGGLFRASAIVEDARQTLEVLGWTEDIRIRLDRGALAVMRAGGAKIRTKPEGFGPTFRSYSLALHESLDRRDVPIQQIKEFGVVMLGAYEVTLHPTVTLPHVEAYGLERNLNDSLQNAARMLETEEHSSD